MAEKLVIEKIYCFIAHNEEGEGICAFQSENGWIPLVGADMKRVDSLMGKAQHISNKTGKRITVCEFDNRVLIKEIKPE